MSRRCTCVVGDKRSMLETLFAEQIRTARLPVPLRDHRFHPTRKWAFDFAWPKAGETDVFGIGGGGVEYHPIAVEAEGGTWIAGRHTRPATFEADCEKYAEALILGWRVLRCTSHMVEDGRAIALLRRLFVS